MNNDHYSTLRPIDVQPIVYEGEPMWLLRDPLQLSDSQLLFPPALVYLLPLIDGTRTTEQIHADFCGHAGQTVDYNIVAGALAQLDAACLLENQRSQAARRSALAAYRAAPWRAPALAGVCYPAEPKALEEALDAYRVPGDKANGASWRGRGIISPHIDYQRGGHVYASVWRRAATAVAEVELVLIFGTDHNGPPGSLTLTRTHYGTPYSLIRTDRDLVERLAEAIGPEHAFRHELHHRQEHSVELSAVWMDHIRRHSTLLPYEMVPILCGSFQHFVLNGHRPADDARLAAFVEALRRETAGRRVLAVASVDFAHVGPAFGDDFEMDASRRAALTASDRSLIEAIRQGDAERFYDEIAAAGDRSRICGFSSIYLLLRYLGKTEGVEIAYEHCPADADDTSLVSISGILLS